MTEPDEYENSDRSGDLGWVGWLLVCALAAGTLAAVLWALL